MNQQGGVVCLVTHHHHRMFYLEGGSRSYTWVKNTLQRAGVVNKAPKRGVHRKRRERAPWPGMMLHQDGSQHQWVAGQYEGATTGTRQRLAGR